MATQTQIAYNRKLQQLVKLVRDDVDAELVPLIKQQAPEYVADAWPDIIAAALRRILARWTSPFAQRQADQIAADFVRSAAEDNVRRQRSFGIDLYGGDDQLQSYLQAAAFQNATLIKSIPAQYLEQVQNIVMGNMRQGMRPSYIEQTLIKQFGITSRRAKLIAADQTSKIQGEMNKIRQVNSGIEFFTWVTAHDERVRHSHNEVSKRDVGYGPGVFRWDNLPIVDGVPTFPGQPVRCRCIARATPRAKVERYLKIKK